ncbi:hypothetical protein GCM10022206_94650 [Streptomyces chiangmaiensis]
MPPVTALTSAEAMWRSTVGMCTRSRSKRSVSRPFVRAGDQVRQGQGVLTLQQQRVHGPERSLCRGRFGRLRGQPCVGVDVAEREVTPDVSHLWVGGERFADGRCRRAAQRTLGVPVLDDCDRRVGRPAVWSRDASAGSLRSRYHRCPGAEPENEVGSPAAAAPEATGREQAGEEDDGEYRREQTYVPAGGGGNGECHQVVDDEKRALSVDMTVPQPCAARPPRARPR